MKILCPFCSSSPEKNESLASENYYRTSYCKPFLVIIFQKKELYTGLMHPYRWPRQSPRTQAMKECQCTLLPATHEPTSPLLSMLNGKQGHCRWKSSSFYCCLPAFGCTHIVTRVFPNQGSSGRGGGVFFSASVQTEAEEKTAASIPYLWKHIMSAPKLSGGGGGWKSILFSLCLSTGQRKCSCLPQPPQFGSTHASWVRQQRRG